MSVRRAVLLLCLPALAVAAEPTTRVDRGVIDGFAGQGMSGVASINQASGRGNVQANLAAFALGGDARTTALQAAAVEAGDAAQGASVRIGDAALSGTTGVLSVNQAAGAANAQLNLLAVGDLAEASVLQTVDVTALAAVAAGAAAPADPAAPRPLRDASIEGAALAHPQGVLQLNQTAGVGNASANAIVLHIPGGTP